MRKKISEHMIQSHLGTARVTVLHEIDVTELIALREELNRHPEKTEDLKISYTHLFIKAIAQALLPMRHFGDGGHQRNTSSQGWADRHSMGDHHQSDL